MSYKTILVHFEGDERAHGLLEVACKLARDAEDIRADVRLWADDQHDLAFRADHHVGDRGG